MKRADLLTKISDAADAKRVTFTFQREGGAHSIYRCGGKNVVIPRHREINEITARGIMRDLEDVLGREWWK